MFRCLEKDFNTVGYNESPDSEMFENKNLLSPKIIKPVVNKHIENDNFVLVKPNKLAHNKQLSDILKQYREFNPSIIWMYRNPINVYYSFCEMVEKHQPHIMEDWRNRISDVFLDDEKGWCARQQKAIDSCKSTHEKITVINYQDFLNNPQKILMHLYDRYGINGNSNAVRVDSNKGQKELSESVQQQIWNHCKTVYEKLESLRLYV